MGRGFWILAGVAFVTWSMIFVLYFRRDMRRWLQSRDRRRAERQELQRQAEAERRRQLDEMASKYLTEASAAKPPAAGP